MIAAPDGPLEPVTADAEAPCPDCIRSMGLCRYHERHELPQLKEPSWPQMIGEAYVCENAKCADHVACLGLLGAAAPRAGCQCHNCAQRRAWSKAQTKASRGTVHSPAYLAAAERRQQAKRTADRRKPVTRLAQGIAGGFTRSRSSTRSPTRSSSVSL